MSRLIRLKIRRQDAPDGQPYWESFEIPSRPHMTVVSALQELRKRPLSLDGRAVVPVVWDCGCHEGLCGSCLMVINGQVAKACSVRLEDLSQPIRLEPLTQFPVQRDLSVDRSRAFDTLTRVKAWGAFDGLESAAPLPCQTEAQRLQALELSRCTMCAACLEVCPQYSPKSDYVGAAAIAQNRLFDRVSGPNLDRAHTSALMGHGGVEDCGQAQNCVKACPEGVPLTGTIGSALRDATKTAMRKIFG